MNTEQENQAFDKVWRELTDDQKLDVLIAYETNRKQVALREFALCYYENTSHRLTSGYISAFAALRGIRAELEK